MTKEDFEKLEMGTSLVLADASFFGKPVKGKAAPSYLFDVSSASRWTFSVNEKRFYLHWTPASDEEFMKKVELLN